MSQIISQEQENVSKEPSEVKGTHQDSGTEDKGQTLAVSSDVEDKNPEDDKAIVFNQNLLVVDDNEINREVAMLTLSSVGFNVDLACDGKEAVDIVSRSEPGHYLAVLMDVRMPVMDGYAATKAIRCLPVKALADIPVIAMTANNYQEDRKAALEAGMNGFITKPITLDEIINNLKNYF